MRFKVFLIMVAMCWYGIAYAADEVVISASRSLIQKKHTASSLSVIDNIDQTQAPFVYDLLRDVPGTAISQSGGVGSLAQLRVRGAESNQTLVVIDGIEANDAGIGSEYNFAHLQTCGVERIEVLRGPQSSLWGSDALAGVVNVQTIKGEGALKFESTTSLGDRNTQQNCTGLSGGGDHYHYSLYGAFYDTDGANVSTQGPEADGYDNYALNFRNGVKLNDVVEIDLAGRVVEATSEFDPFVSMDGETDINNSYIGSNIHVKLKENRWTHRVGVALTDTENENDADGIETSSTEGQKVKIDYQTDIVFETRNADHIVTLVAEREKEEFDQTGIPSIFGNPNQDQNITNYGYVAEYRAGLFEKMYVSASMRADDNDEFGNRTNYRFGLAYLHNNSKLHVAYGTASKNPTFTERFGFTPDNFIGNENLRPERSKGWEIGIAHEVSDSLDFGVTYFSEELIDEINGFYFDPIAAAFTAVNVDGNSDRKGIEFEFNAAPIKNVEVKGSYTYLDANQHGDNGRTTEIRRPKNTANLSTHYSFDKGNVILRINFVEDQLDNDFSSFPAQRVVLDDYYLVSLAGEYQINQWMALRARVENLLDENYQDVFGFETRGINAHAGLKVSFQ